MFLKATDPSSFLYAGVLFIPGCIGTLDTSGGAYTTGDPQRIAREFNITVGVIVSVIQ